MTGAHIVAGAMLLAVFATNVSAQECEQYAKANFKIIREAPTFSMSALGDEPRTPPVQIAFRCLLKRDDARDRLVTLFDDATPSGRLYAAAGLALLAPKEGNQFLAALRKQDSPVTYAAGCMVRTETVASLAELLQAKPDLMRDLIRPRRDVPSALTFPSNELEQR
jgi:hypothetical protein